MMRTAAPIGLSFALFAALFFFSERGADEVSGPATDAALSSVTSEPAPHAARASAAPGRRANILLLLTDDGATSPSRRLPAIESGWRRSEERGMGARSTRGLSGCLPLPLPFRGVEFVLTIALSYLSFWQKEVDLWFISRSTAHPPLFT